MPLPDSGYRHQIYSEAGDLAARAAKWSARGDAVTLIAGAGVAPTLKALANNSNKLGNAVDLSAAADRHMLALVTLKVRGASAFTASTVVKLWLLAESTTAGTYEDGADATTPARDPDYEFPLAAVATQQTLVALVGLPPGKFKPLVRNEGGQAFTNTDGENELSMQVVSESEV